MFNEILIQSTSLKISSIYFNQNQIYLTAVVLNNDADPLIIFQEIYQQIGRVVQTKNLRIVQERLFGSINLRKSMLEIREKIFREDNIYEDSLVTYIQGNPIWGEGFAGVQIYAVKPSHPEEKVWTVFDDTIPCGRAWKYEGTTFVLLHDIHGLINDDAADNSIDRQTERMFERTNRLLQKEGMKFRHVIRTWIYIAKILDWYDKFNLIRNKKYQEYNLLPINSGEVETEHIYLPASTGIEGDNPHRATSTMDVLALQQEANSSITVTHNTGLKQRSPFRYGSAFSRSTVINSTQGSTIYISGTASIDEEGKSIGLNNSEKQIRNTLDIVSALIQQDGASLQQICQATVFLKNAEDYPLYQNIIKEYNLENLPAVCIIADVCRDDLLFEIDAVATTSTIGGKVSQNGKM